MKLTGFVRVLIPVLIICTLCACGKQTQEEKPQFFEGTILEINEKTITVSISEIYEIFKSGQTASVLVDEELLQELKVGDFVRVEYSGTVGETLPLTIQTVSVMKLMKLTEEPSIWDSISENHSHVEPVMTMVEDVQLTSPPKMNVSCNKNVLEVNSGTSSWSYQVNPNEWCSVESDGAHPIQTKYLEDLITGTEDLITMEIIFDTKPKQITVLRRYAKDTWNTEKFDEYYEYPISSEITYPYSFQFQNDSDYIYEIQAVWDSTTYRGNAVYGFRTIQKN